MRRRSTVRSILAFTTTDYVLIVAGALLGAVVALIVSVVVPPVYTSTSILYVGPVTTAPGPTPVPAPAGAPGTATPTDRTQTVRTASYAALLTSPRVAADASALLGGSVSPDEIGAAVSAEAVPRTTVIDLAVTSASPQEARAVAGAVTTAFVRMAGTVEPTPPPAEATRSVPAAQPVQVVSAPTVTGPTGMPVWARFLIGIVAGLLVGLVVAVARRWSHRSVDSGGALARRIGVDVAVDVPALPSRPRRPALLADPPPGARGFGVRGLRTRAEAVRLLRSGLRASAGDPRCLVVTGVGAGQATSTTASDLAIAYALAGESVVLVEADLRRPVLAYAFGLDPVRGLSDVLDGRCPLDEAVQRWTPGGIDVLPAGSTVEVPDVLFAQDRIGPLLEVLRERYQRIVLDAPPAAAAADTVDLGRSTDGALLVCRRGAARPHAVDAAVDALRTSGVPLLGAVLTFAVGVPQAPVDARRPHRVDGAPVEAPPEPPEPPELPAVAEPLVPAVPPGAVDYHTPRPEQTVYAPPPVPISAASTPDDGVVEVQPRADSPWSPFGFVDPRSGVVTGAWNGAGSQSRDDDAR